MTIDHFAVVPENHAPFRYTPELPEYNELGYDDKQNFGCLVKSFEEKAVGPKKGTKVSLSEVYLREYSV